MEDQVPIQGEIAWGDYNKLATQRKNEVVIVLLLERKRKKKEKKWTKRRMQKYP